MFIILITGFFCRTCFLRPFIYLLRINFSSPANTTRLIQCRNNNVVFLVVLSTNLKPCIYDVNWRRVCNLLIRLCWNMLHWFFCMYMSCYYIFWNYYSNLSYVVLLSTFNRFFFRHLKYCALFFVACNLIWRLRWWPQIAGQITLIPLWNK